jgi:flagellar hook-associated protein 2
VTPIASFSGLASGIDTSSLIAELVRMERRPITTLQAKQGDLSAIGRRLSDMKTKLAALQEAAGRLDARDEVLSSRATSSDEEAFLVTADGGASLGTYDVQVLALARAQRTYTTAFAAPDQTGLFGVGDLTIQVGADAPVVISVDASDTLESIAAKINASGAALSAGLLFDGTTYRMQVTGNDTGAARSVAFTEGGTLALGLSDPANVVQAAQDASFVIDGFAMTRPTNGADDAIPGVTMTFQALTTGAATMTIARDPEALEERITDFVDAYNAVMTSINAEFAYDGQAALGDSLSGDAMLRTLQRRLRAEAGRVLGGFADPYNRLSGMGVELQSDGTLALDQEAFASAVAADPEAVSRMLVGDAVEQGLMSRFDDLVEEYTRSGDGLIAQKIDSLDGRKRRIDDQIDRMEARIEKFESRLRAQFAAMEQLVSSLTGQGQQMLSIMGQLQ